MLGTAGRRVAWQPRHGSARRGKATQGAAWQGTGDHAARTCGTFRDSCPDSAHGQCQTVPGPPPASRISSGHRWQSPV